MSDAFALERALALQEYEEATAAGDRQRQIAALGRLDRLAACERALSKYWRGKGRT
jgi:hypothetical protein